MADESNEKVSAPCTAAAFPGELTSDDQLRAGALTSTLWDRPDRGPLQLNVVFLDGHPTVQDLVRSHVRAWEDAAHLKFNFLGIDRYLDAHIRITMPPSRIFQSFLGTGSLMLDRRLPSMTLGFTDDVLANPREVRRLVLHEFGHAIGLMHEHQNPRGGLKFKVPEVYQYFWQTYRWDERTVRDQVIQPTRIEELKNATTFDPDSIMLYAFPASIIAAGPVTATKLNYELSENDRRYIASLYPKEGERPPAPDSRENLRPTGYLPLSIGRRTAGTIPIRGAEIPYGFEISQPGRYVLETYTPSGAREEYWVLTLFDADRTFLEADLQGSSPHGLNAMIDRKLGPGRYLLNVRHRLRSGLGDYGVLVRKVK